MWSRILARRVADGPRNTTEIDATSPPVIILFDGTEIANSSIRAMKRKALTSDEIEKIARLLKDLSVSQKDIARRFDCSRAVISAINERLKVRMQRPRR